MTEPLYLNIDGVYDARELSLPWADIIGPGIIEGGGGAVLGNSLKVQALTPASMGVEVIAGCAWVKNGRTNDTEAFFEGGAWRVLVNSLQLPIEPADPSLTRHDRVILEVLDKQFGQASDEARLRVIKGTPSSSPVVPSIPRWAIDLAHVVVDAGASSIAAAKIFDARYLARVGGGKLSVAGRPGIVTALPAPSDGAEVYLRPDAGRPHILWHLRYNAASASPNKWEAVGAGLPLTADDYTSRSLSGSAIYATTSFTLSLAGLPAGEYYVESTGDVDTTTIGNIMYVKSAVASGGTDDTWAQAQSPARSST